MHRLLQEPGKTLDVMDAGTTMRFLTAYFAIMGKSKIITGSERMKQRPIGPLVKALQEIGAEIIYLGKEGYPPLELGGFSTQAVSEITLPGNVSSQFVSAIMMVAPTLPKGLSIHLKDAILSKPYIIMTELLMKVWGVSCVWNNQTIQIPHAEYRTSSYSIESDWSAASYWFALVAAADDESEIKIPLISNESIQGDRIIVELMDKLGVHSNFTSKDLILTKKQHQSEIEIDFKNFPDLAQTIIPLAAIKGIKGIFTGLESLRIKETDRIIALQSELKKIGADLKQAENQWQLSPATAIPESITIKTYTDHRMAMGFMPLITKTNLTIENPEVVNKSYPEFWNDLKSLGVVVT